MLEAQWYGALYLDLCPSEGLHRPEPNGMDTFAATRNEKGVVYLKPRTILVAWSALIGIQRYRRQLRFAYVCQLSDTITFCLLDAKVTCCVESEVVEHISLNIYEGGALRVSWAYLYTGLGVTDHGKGGVILVKGGRRETNLSR